MVYLHILQPSPRTRFVEKMYILFRICMYILFQHSKNQKLSCFKSLYGPYNMVMWVFILFMCHHTARLRNGF